MMTSHEIIAKELKANEKDAIGIKAICDSYGEEKIYKIYSEYCYRKTRNKSAKNFLIEWKKYEYKENINEYHDLDTLNILNELLVMMAEKLQFHFKNYDLEIYIKIPAEKLNTNCNEYFKILENGKVEISGQGYKQEILDKIHEKRKEESIGNYYNSDTLLKLYLQDTYYEFENWKKSPIEFLNLSLDEICKKQLFDMKNNNISEKIEKIINGKI